MRTKPDGYYVQSAVIPYRRDEGRVEILLITSRKRRRWVLPKGVCEPDMTAADSAAKEAMEEAGVRGSVSTETVGRYRYREVGWHLQRRGVHDEESRWSSTSGPSSSATGSG